MIDAWYLARAEGVIRTNIADRDEVLEICLEESRETGEPIRNNDLMAIRVMSGMVIELAGQIVSMRAGADFCPRALARLRSSGDDLRLLHDLIG